MFVLKRSGITLLELIVTSALFVVLGSLFVWFLVTTSQVTSQGTARMDIQQRALLVTRRISRDLEESDRQSISLHSKAEADPGEPVVICGIPLQDVDPQGGRLWREEVFGYYWIREENAVYHRKWPPKADPAAFSVDPLPKNRPYRLSEDELLLFAAGEGTRLSDHVVDFDASWQGNAVSLKLSLQQDVAGKQAPLTFAYERVVAIRN